MVLNDISNPAIGFESQENAITLIDSTSDTPVPRASKDTIADAILDRVTTLRSPRVKRQYSGTLGKIGNCQVGVSLHAVGAKGTAPLGWALYLPEEWCEDAERRRKAKIPADVVFKSKPELGVELVERAAGWEVSTAPVLGDQAYGENTKLRERLDVAELQYVLSVGPTTKVFEPGTAFAVPGRKGRRGPSPSRPQADREPSSLGDLLTEFDTGAWQEVAFRDSPEGEPVSSRFCFLRVRAANRARTRVSRPPREEWLIAEWPEGAEQPTDFWLSNLPDDAEPEHLARLARMRWKIELDYRQLKGELGLDHYEGRSYLGWHHHTALVTAAHGFLPLSGSGEGHRDRTRWPYAMGELYSPQAFR